MLTMTKSVMLLSIILGASLGLAATGLSSRPYSESSDFTDWQSFTFADIKYRATPPGGATGLTENEKNEIIAWLVSDALSN